MKKDNSNYKYIASCLLIFPDDSYTNVTAFFNGKNKESVKKQFDYYLGKKYGFNLIKSKRILKRSCKIEENPNYLMNKEDNNIYEQMKLF